MKVKYILVTQPKPETAKSPYFALAKKYSLKIDFCPFIQVTPIPAKLFRKEKINILDYPAVIFTSRNAVDQFFRMCGELRVTPAESVKYFCLSETVGYYLQKYVVFRKRRIFFGNQTIEDLLKIIYKFPEEKYLVPCSDTPKQRVLEVLAERKLNFKKAVIYKALCADLAEINIRLYDIIVLFSPLDVKSLFKNFPKFRQQNVRIAAFGPAVVQAVNKAKLRLDIMAPIPGAPSMPVVLDHYIRKSNK
ncbi:MAG TPA: uroporphyrinogen-III synthase [Bacteroidia bacterium]|nr:uroporphyrinogen-III synthase [Bacteroidia bacterium]